VNTQQSRQKTSQEAELLDHECDGIREYDNPMPAWWTGIFWISILFALPYFAFYHLGGVGTTLADNYETEVGAFYEMQAAKLGNLKPDAPTILTLATDGQKMLAGRNMFRANCATCHGPDGGGLTGPNLTDDHYINIRQPEDIFRVVHDGLPSKGMPEWASRFSEPQLVLLAAYVASLRGTHASAPRDPQGDRVAPWSARGAATPPTVTTAVGE
jgi:cytochrome c oxidase cbb3-type subunit 3